MNAHLASHQTISSILLAYAGIRPASTNTELGSDVQMRCPSLCQIRTW
jgi:hypothetical protein